MLQTISTRAFAQTLCDIWKSNDRRICFVLGAGASKTSGIRTGGELAKIWLDEIKFRMDDQPSAFKTFLEEKNIDEKNPGYSYSEIYHERFKLDPVSGFDCINREMENARPKYGYSVLAQILATKQHNIVITTNFDSLTEEALYTYTASRPLVCGHESLAAFAKPSVNRPLIVKIHRDRFYGPQSQPNEIDKINEAWLESLNNIFQSNIVPVFIGYGGNDGSLMGYLEKINRFDNVFWCERNGTQISQRVQSLLEKHEGKHVVIKGFDELMFLLQDSLKLPVLVSDIRSIAENRANEYQETVEKIRNSQAASKDIEVQQAAERLVEKVADSWWSWHLRAKAEKDRDKKKKIYEDGLKVFPNSYELHSNYGNFLSNIHDFTNAERHHEISLGLDKDDLNYCSYAICLLKQKKYDLAEEYLQAALKIKPNSIQALSTYGSFLSEIKGDLVNAEKCFDDLANIEIHDANVISSYATFLVRKKNYDEAEHYYLQALEMDPSNENINCNYAGLLFIKNKVTDGLAYLNLAHQSEDFINITAEIYFYQYAHIKEMLDEAFSKLKELLCAGVRSLGFNLQANVDVAISQQNHPNPTMLQRLADILSKDHPIGDLCED